MHRVIPFQFVLFYEGGIRGLQLKLRQVHTDKHFFTYVHAKRSYIMRGYTQVPTVSSPPKSDPFYEEYDWNVRCGQVNACVLSDVPAPWFLTTQLHRAD